MSELREVWSRSLPAFGDNWRARARRRVLRSTWREAPVVNAGEVVRPIATDRDGAPVTIAPRTWLVCFVPGLRKQWWHRFVLSRHKHVFALQSNDDGSWTLFEPWWSRLLVATVTSEDAVPFLRWGMLGEILAVREHVPGAGSQIRGWMNCAALTAFLLGRGYWVWSPGALHRRLSREPGVVKVDLRAALKTHFEHLAACTFTGLRSAGAAAGGEADLARVLEGFGRDFVTALLAEATLGNYRTAIAESTYLPEIAQGYWSGGGAAVNSYLADLFVRIGRCDRLQIANCERAAAQFLGLLRSGLHLSVALGIRASPTPDEIDQHVKSAVGIFLRGVRKHCDDDARRAVAT